MIESLASVAPNQSWQLQDLQKGVVAEVSLLEDHRKTAFENRDSADSDIANHARLVLGAFRDTPREVHAQNLETVSEALEHAGQIEDLFDSLGGIENSVNLGDLRDLLPRVTEVRQAISQAKPETDAGDEGAVGVEVDGSVPMSGSRGSMGGKVASRQQAAEQLERIASFFEQSEPSRLMPYLLRVHNAAIGKNFLELIDELGQTKDQALLILSPDQAEQQNSNEQTQVLTTSQVIGYKR